MSKIKYINIFLLIALLGLLLLSVLFRYNSLDSHFSHVDDLIVPRVFNSINSSNEFIQKVNTKVELNEVSQNIIKVLYPVLKPLLFAVSVSGSSTYAPIQFVFSSFLLDEHYSYKDTLFWSRIPSFIAFIISLFLFFYVVRGINKKESKTSILFGITILASSWQFCIYSMQSQSYAIGVMAVFILFITFIRLINDDKLSNLKAFNYGIILSILMFTQYQILFFLPAFFIISGIIKFEQLKKILIIFFIQVFSFIVLYTLFLKNLVGNGLNWNVGVNKEFLFELPDGFLNIVNYSLDFFINNSYITFKSLVIFMNSSINTVVTIFFIILFFIGLFSFAKSSLVLKKSFFYFTVISFLTWISLIMMQKLTLSPTRHSLILIGFIALYVFFGFNHLLGYIRQIQLKRFFILALSVFVSFSFSFNYQKVFTHRVDKFDEKEIKSIINKHNINTIYNYNWTWNLVFMPSIMKDFEIVNSNRNIYLKKKENKDEKNIMIITHRNRLNKESIKDILRSIDINNYKDYFIKYKKEDFSDTQISISDLTKNGTNSLAIYILGVDK